MVQCEKENGNSSKLLPENPLREHESIIFIELKRIILGL